MGACTRDSEVLSTFFLLNTIMLIESKCGAVIRTAVSAEGPGNTVAVIMYEGTSKWMNGFLTNSSRNLFNHAIKYIYCQWYYDSVLPEQPEIVVGWPIGRSWGQVGEIIITRSVHLYSPCEEPISRSFHSTSATSLAVKSPHYCRSIGILGHACHE